MLDSQPSAVVLPGAASASFLADGRGPGAGARIGSVEPSLLVRPMVERAQTPCPFWQPPLPRHALSAVGATCPRGDHPTAVGRERASGDGALANTLALLQAGAPREPDSGRPPEPSARARREPSGI